MFADLNYDDFVNFEKPTPFKKTKALGLADRWADGRTDGWVDGRTVGRSDALVGNSNI